MQMYIDAAAVGNTTSRMIKLKLSKEKKEDEWIQAPPDVAYITMKPIDERETEKMTTAPNTILGAPSKRKKRNQQYRFI